MMKRVDVIFILSILISLTALLVFANYEQGAVSAIDNRALSELEIESLEKAPMAISAYYDDRVAFRESFINAYTLLNDRIFGVMVHPMYSYGQDGYVFFKPARYWDRRPFLKKFAAYIRKVQDFCESRGVPFIYMLNPNKESIYTEKLPRGYEYDQSNTDYFVQELERLNVRLVNTIPLLKEKHWDEQVYNVKYDAGHWNDRGCFEATQALFEEFQKDFPHIRMPSMDDFALGETLKTTLPVSYFPINEEVPAYSPKNPKAIQDESLVGDLLISERFPYYYRSKTASTDPSLLFFHGSYYAGRDRFLNEYFSDYTAIHNYMNIFDVDYYLNVFTPDMVILSTTEYATTGGYFKESVFENISYPAALSEYPLPQQDGSDIQAELSLSKNRGLVELDFAPAVEGDYEAAYVQIGERIFDIRTAQPNDLAPEQSLTDKRFSGFSVTLLSSVFYDPNYQLKKNIVAKYYLLPKGSAVVLTGALRIKSQ